METVRRGNRRGHFVGGSGHCIFDAKTRITDT
jgi:hypothetical protein